MRIAVAMGFCLLAVAAHAATPPAELQTRVRAATFEVVVPKPAEGGVTYERAPPYELLPFTERNDKFWPLGTAFAIAPGVFVSAAHVFQAGMGGMGGPPRLRDASGQTFVIESVLKYSMHQDFVVFTAPVKTHQVLEASTEFRLDEPVFAVGNALGEGVIIRDGLLTSLTPEDQDGRWKWLRYSAATSPGNSGGPLLNAAGKVIGVVIGKSQGENLNYALPMEHVNAATGVASIDVRAPLRVSVLRDYVIAKYDITFPLPLAFAEFERQHRVRMFEGYQAERARLLNEHAAELFPKGNSAALLAGVEAAYCPMLVAQSQDKTWVLDSEQRENRDLPDGGKICSQVSATAATFHLDRGKSKNPEFYASKRVAMDLLLKGLDITRGFGSENVKVTSLGAPVSESAHRDKYGRRWTSATFALPYLDLHLVALFLPTPDGYAGMIMVSPRGGLEMTLDQLRFNSDYFYVSYSGTLPQWQAYLARADLRPAALDHVKLTRDAGGLHVHSRRIDFDVPSTLLQLDDSSILQIQMSYALERGAAVWDASAIYVNLDEEYKTYVGLIRQPKPTDTAGKELNDRWSEMLVGKGAFDPGRGHDSDYKKLWRRAAVGAGYKPGSSVDPAATLLYEVLSVVQDAKLPKRIDDMQDLLLENVRVKER